MKDNGYFIKTLFRKFALPTVVALLASTISTFVNSIMAGTYFGNNGLAVIGICSPVFFLFATLGALIGAGSANVASKYMGEEDFDEVSKLYSTALVLIIIIGVLISTIGILFESNIVNLLGGNAQAGATAYYKNYIPFGIFTMLIYIPMNFTRIDGKPRVGLYMFLTMAISNLLANFLLINVFDMGIESIALGTAIGAFSASAVGFIFLQGKNNHIRFIKSKVVFTKTKLMPILFAGSPMAFNNLFNLIKVLGFNALLISLGSSSLLATISVIWTLNTFLFAIMSGFGQAIVPLVGVFNQEKDNTSMRQIVKLAISIGLIIFLLIGLFLIIFWKQTFALFGLTNICHNERLIMILFALKLIIEVSNVVLSFYFTAAGKIWLANIITIGKGILFILPIAYILSFFIGTTAIWLSFSLAEICTLILFLICSFVKHRNNEKISFPLLMDKKFEDGGKYISFSVANEAQAITEAAAKVTDFCEANKLSPKQTMLISMSIEEMLGLIITHSVNKLQDFIAVRIIITDGTIILRMRNVGKKFNPIEYYWTNISDDIEKSMDVIGVKYILDKAEIVDYRETFGVNNLVIIL